MNKLFTIFSYELKAAIRTKSFIFTTIFIIAGLVIGSLFLKYVILNENKGLEETIEGVVMGDQSSEEAKKVGYLLENDKIDEKILKDLYPNYKMEAVNSREDLTEKISSNQLDLGVIFLDDNKLELLYNIAPAFPKESVDIADGLKRYFADQELSKYKISLEEVKDIENKINIETKISSIKGNNSATIPVAMFISIILYMLIIINGQMAAMNVAREKNDRTMELLITSTKPTYLINGKVLASFSQSMLTLLSIGLGVFFAYLINKDFVSMLIANKSFAIDPMIIVIAIMYFVVGYILYLYIYAALGATVSTTEEINSAVAPIMIVVVVVYFTTIMALSNPNPNNALLKILSFVPFSSMFTMHARYALAEVPMTEVFISFGLLLLTTIILSALCVKLYRNASLNYGNEKKLFRRVKKIFSKKK